MAVRHRKGKEGACVQSDYNDTLACFVQVSPRGIVHQSRQMNRHEARSPPSSQRRVAVVAATVFGAHRPFTP